MKKVALFFLWFTLTNVTLVFSIVYLYIFVNFNKEKPLEAQAKEVLTQNPYQLYTAQPGNKIVTKSLLNTEDARPILVKNFLDKYKSPLSPYSDHIVKVADKVGIDYAFIPAMSMQESGGCKIIPDNSYNCWGYGIYGDKIYRFSSFEEGIEKVSQKVKEFMDQGLTNPDLLMSRWTPSSPGTWSYAVNKFMIELKRDE
ncbi:MAG: hypothetical protein UT63_C0064G0018 [Candidatus Gottesmanbacteria bacterium GW2011_GWC2_39_8]|uniref:Mannosyl-glycoprotein endo-beta-N-acetylglucosamidase-like domain-containing protein n=1 Tax=Candidatus Gottesmanbacteria bacterium GW2011_GWC2_39_8 TaxID=1618450 RepID=A0A0G0Q2Q7_9BACT|nr:MAG: hypothetical protein UT63_C0064G0018 [Candidatus Gottesmanbacteria bacterium GW2011_GWC2_39_8]